MTKQLEWYFAGIMDGEGCININLNRKRNEYRLRLSVTNTSIELMEWLKHNIGGYYYHRKKQKPSYKEKYEWCIYASNIQKHVVLMLKNKLVIKPKQLDIALKFLSTIKYTGGKKTPEIFLIREKLWNEMKILNGKGANDLAISS